MRKLVAVVIALILPLFLATQPVQADPYVDNALIEGLLDDLARADSEAEADEISYRIWTEWFSPNDPKLATHMSVMTNLLGEGLAEESLHELGIIVSRYPDYAEGWNQRATRLYNLGRYEEALADTERVLAIQPRHFGAMAGRVLILLKQNKDLEALKQMRAALAIHPFLRERRLFPETAGGIGHA